MDSYLLSHHLILRWRPYIVSALSPSLLLKEKNIVGPKRDGDVSREALDGSRDVVPLEPQHVGVQMVPL
jgi:hypothetical protein